MLLMVQAAKNTLQGLWVPPYIFVIADCTVFFRKHTLERTTRAQCLYAHPAVKGKGKGRGLGRVVQLAEPMGARTLVSRRFESCPYHRSFHGLATVVA